MQRECSVPLTPEERAAIASDLADCIEDIGTEQAEQDAEKAEMKQRLAILEARKRNLAQTYRRGVAARQIEVQVQADFREGVARYVRVDTGEVVEQRPLTDAERQPPLIPETAAAAAGAMAVDAEE
jgi:hypothetical protein